MPSAVISSPRLWQREMMVRAIAAERSLVSMLAIRLRSEFDARQRATVAAMRAMTSRYRNRPARWQHRARAGGAAFQW